MKKFILLPVAFMASAAMAAVPAGVETAITTGGTDANTVAGYILVALAGLWGLKRAIGLLR